MSLLSRARRRTAALAGALALTTVGAAAVPAHAGGIDPVTSKCYIAPNICLYETSYNAGFTSWSLTDAAYTPYGYPGLHQCYSYVAYLGSSSGTLPLPVVAQKSTFLTICR